MRVSEFAEYSNRISADHPAMRDDAPRLQSSLALLRTASPPSWPSCPGAWGCCWRPSTAC
jgi:hypothetical protein